MSTDKQLQERVKELSCLYDVSRKLLEAGIEPDCLQWVVNRIPEGWQFPEQTAAQLTLGDRSFVSRALSDEEVPDGAKLTARFGEDGQIEVFTSSGEFLAEEEALLEALADRLNEALDRDRMETALRESEARYRQIVETAQEGVWVIDAEGQTTFANRTMERMLGCEPGEMLGKSMYDFMDPEDESQARRNLQRRSAGVAEQHEFRLRRKDGGHVYTLMSANPLHDENGNFVEAVAMTTDLTERKRIEERLREAQTLEAVGRLARGVAHDFNNLLTAIQANVDLLGLDLSHQDELFDHVEQIELAVRQASGLTQQLMVFSHQQQVKKERIDLAEEIRGMEPLLGSILLHKGVELVVSCHAPTLPVVANHSQLSQVLLNLVVNARDAVERGGEVIIEAAEVVLSEDDDALGLVAGHYARLRVIDDGVGMDEETRRLAMEPFFTTRKHGTGLGLATVYGLVTRAGGVVDLQSELGEGTTATVYWPLVDDASDMA